MWITMAVTVAYITVTAEERARTRAVDTGTHTVRMFIRLRRLSLATQFLLLQVVIVGLVVVVGTALAVLYAQRDGQSGARQRVLDISQTFARSPDVVAALQSPNPSAELQPRAESVRRAE